MSYLLDTNVWLRLVEDPERLSAKVHAVVSETGNYPLGLSAISPWAVAKKVSKGLLDLSLPVEKWMARALQDTFIVLQPLTPEIAVESCRLPGDFHNDPADQIIAATARMHDLTLLTSDRRLLDYSHVRAVWD